MILPLCRLYDGMAAQGYGIHEACHHCIYFSKNRKFWNEIETLWRHALA